MAGACEPHPTDEGKFQHAFSEYGHGPGNGKSRSAVFKHHKKLNTDSVQTPAREGGPAHADANAPTHEAGDSVQTDDEIVSEEPDSVQDVSETLGRISWADDSEVEPKPRTIPKPLSDVARGRQSIVTREATASMLRYSYVALDRLVSHWGQGVMNRPNYNIERSEADYDALQDSTVAVLDHYGVEVPMSPLMVWGATIGAAYGPPVAHIRRHADPNRVKGNWFRGLRSRVTSFFKRTPKRKATGPSTRRDKREQPEP
mgnify:CR=1 FL=1